jgi:hypothetical protein
VPPLSPGQPRRRGRKAWGFNLVEPQDRCPPTPPPSGADGADAPGPSAAPSGLEMIFYLPVLGLNPRLYAAAPLGRTWDRSRRARLALPSFQR